MCYSLTEDVEASAIEYREIWSVGGMGKEKVLPILPKPWHGETT